MLVLLLLPLVVALRKSNELFCLDWHEGSLTVRRGRVPPQLLGDFSDVLRGTRARRAVVRAVSLHRVPRLEVKGELTPGEVQQLRNVLGTYPAHKLRAFASRR